MKKIVVFLIIVALGSFSSQFAGKGRASLPLLDPTPSHSYVSIARSHFFAFNKAMPKDPLPLQRRGVVAIERINAAVDVADSFLLHSIIEPVMTEDEYYNDSPEMKVSQKIIFDELEKYAKNVSSWDTLIIYSHTHGLKNEFIPEEPWGGLRLDAPPRNRRPLPHRGVTIWPQYAEQLLAIEAKTVIVMIMSCFAGGFIDYLMEIEDQWNNRADEGKNFIVITSQNNALPSGPVMIEGEFINPFTYAVEQALLGHPDGAITGEKDGFVSLEEWAQYIMETTSLNDPRALPQMIGSYHPDQILFKVKNTEQPDKP